MRPLTRRPLTDDDLDAVAALAARCLAVDGGLPLSAAESFLRRRYVGGDTVGRAVIGGAGTLVAAAAVRRQQTDGIRRAVLTGLVDPAHRRRGVGSRLLDWGLATAATLADGVIVETEALTGAGRRLLRRRGLAQVFAEDVMRFDLGATPIPPVRLPAGVTLTPWTSEAAERFFAVYEAAFRDRPGFPGWSARRWVDWTSGGDDFRPQWSTLATDPVAGDVGFVTCAEGWIVQVGAVPAVRGRGVGSALVAEALERMRSAGRPATLLDVNVDNPAGRLYGRLGFAVIGRRARFVPAG